MATKSSKASKNSSSAVPVEDVVDETTEAKKPSKKTKPVENEVVKESQKKIYVIDIRAITSSLHNNHRYPGTQQMSDAGYGLYEPLPSHPDHKPLWNLATSEDPAERAEFTRVMELYEGTNPAEPTIIDLATSIYGGVEGQLHPAYVRDNGKKKGKQTFTLIAGHRRMIAILWLWCRGMRDTPTIEAKLVKGNGLSLGALQKDENAQRKQVSPIIVAQGYRRSLNEGATLEQVATANGVSEQTVNNWLAFLELEPAEQKKLEANKLRHEDAIQIVTDRRNGGDGKTNDGLTAEEAVAKRPAKGGKRNRKKNKLTTKRMIELYVNPPSHWSGVTPAQVKFVIGVLLGEHDCNGVAIAVASTAPTDTADDELEAVLPPDGVSIGLMEDDNNLTIDDNGNIVVEG